VGRWDESSDESYPRAILSYNRANGNPGDGGQHETGVGGFAEAGAIFF
jgi:hypothetical protein